MSELVNEEIKRLRLLSDVEIMNIYIKQITSGFPMMVIVKALDTVMKEKNIQATDITTMFNFLDSTGKEKSIQMREEFK